MVTQNTRSKENYFEFGIDILTVGEFYNKSAEHLQEEMARIGALILLYFRKTGIEVVMNNQKFGSLFISKAEENSIMQAVWCDTEACHFKLIKQT